MCKGSYGKRKGQLQRGVPGILDCRTMSNIICEGKYHACTICAAVCICAFAWFGIHEYDVGKYSLFVAISHACAPHSSSCAGLLLSPAQRMEWSSHVISISSRKT